MVRVYDPDVIREAIESFKQSNIDISPEEWIELPTNIALVNDRGDIALFEIGFKNIYSGHYYFKSRGRQAIKAAREFLDELFNTCYNIDILLGLTPLNNLPARWISRQIGFKSHGVVEGPKRHYEMFIITKKEFNNGWTS